MKFKQKRIDSLMNILIYLAAIICLSLLLWIIGFIFLKGFKHVNHDFLRSDYEAETQYINYESPKKFSKESDYYSIKFGFQIQDVENKNEKFYKITLIDKESPLNYGKLGTGERFIVKKNFLISQFKVGEQLITPNDLTSKEVITLIDDYDFIQIKVTNPGGGIYPLIVSTLLLIVVTLLIATPIGILAAIYLVEYAKPGKLVSTIRFATETMTGIPSIIYGIFGFLMFVQRAELGRSVISGAFTLSILLLPYIIRTTEEALKTVPLAYKEGSYGLGANKIQTIWKIILPSSIPGILVGIILSIGRIVGESAALIFTLGTFAKLPIHPQSGKVSVYESATTLTVRAFIEVKEHGNVEMAAAIGVVILLVVFILNTLSKMISKRLNKAGY
jgi:phosphate transport system permease protein